MCIFIDYVTRVGIFYAQRFSTLIRTWCTFYFPVEFFTPVDPVLISAKIDNVHSDLAHGGLSGWIYHETGECPKTSLDWFINKCWSFGDVPAGVTEIIRRHQCHVFRNYVTRLMTDNTDHPLTPEDRFASEWQGLHLKINNLIGMKNSTRNTQRVIHILPPLITWIWFSWRNNSWLIHSWIWTKRTPTTKHVNI